ncbi:azoreductase [Spiroplasma chinense]|uniref:FMN dependent NADH:quinone oxidoreductase n=1 Tax=Spiroplasma chinense TaxID=216932 RepID=A0A5B9Y4C4_9MOLU|nr:FMN-dependent NADH-azoreductase [Spiroplasma chinense]QEH61810.1 azoreductase [Spiroplasma chinense]
MSNKVLVISGTVTAPEKSYSIGVVNLFLEHYTKLNPNDEIIHLDLNNEPMAQKTLTRDNFSTFFNEKDSLEYIKQLKSVDKVIISSPMNNFAVSGLIKNYLDHVLLADQTFSYKYSKKGDAIGLLDNLKVQIITTQGAPKGWYPFGDHSAFLKGTFEFVGADVKEPILLAGTKVAPLSGQTPIEAAKSIEDVVVNAAQCF